MHSQKWVDVYGSRGVFHTTVTRGSWLGLRDEDHCIRRLINDLDDYTGRRTCKY